MAEESLDGEAGALRRQMEDNVLNPVAEGQRMGGWALLANTAGVGTTLAMLLIGGTSSYVIGVGWTMVAAAISAAFGSLIGTCTGLVTQSTGMSSTVTTRFYGLGARGSAIASFVFAWMILSFLALENVLLYNATIFAFGWHPTVLNAVVIYAVLTVGWILLALFGIKLIQSTSLWLTIVTGILMITVLVLAVTHTTSPLGSVFGSPSGGISLEAFLAMLSGIVGFAGALSLTGADFARYARTRRDVKIMAIGGNVIVNFGVVSLGAWLYQAGQSMVAGYLAAPANSAVAGVQAGGTLEEKVQFLANNNTGAYFIILAGIVGFVVIYAAQVKAQAMNAYSGSLALSNLFDAVFKRTPSRVVMLVLGNALALVAVFAGILGFLVQFLAALGVATFSLCALVIADYFIVRRGKAASTREVENWNWAGVVALVLGFAVSYGLQLSGVFSLGFVATLVLTPLFYIVLRRLLPEGAGTRLVPGTTVLQEAGEEPEYQDS